VNDQEVEKLPFGSLLMFGLPSSVEGVFQTRSGQVGLPCGAHRYLKRL